MAVEAFLTSSDLEDIKEDMNFSKQEFFRKY